MDYSDHKISYVYQLVLPEQNMQGQVFIKHIINFTLK